MIPSSIFIILFIMDCYHTFCSVSFIISSFIHLLIAGFGHKSQHVSKCISQNWIQAASLFYFKISALTSLAINQLHFPTSKLLSSQISFVPMGMNCLHKWWEDLELSLITTLSLVASSSWTDKISVKFFYFIKVIFSQS